MNSISLPTNTTKSLSILTNTFFLIALLLGAYLVSYKKGKITNKRDNPFTVSQSLAFGNKYVMLIFFTLAYIALGLLVNSRGGRPAFLYGRLFLILVSYVFLITLIWITTFRSQKKHYIFAVIIFISNLLFQLLTIVSLYHYVEKKKVLIGQGIIDVLIVFGLFLFLMNSADSNLFTNLFASTENLMVVSMGCIILTLGFI
jgi:hypothetical protein